MRERVWRVRIALAKRLVPDLYWIIRDCRDNEKFIESDPDAFWISYAWLHDIARYGRIVEP